MNKSILTVLAALVVAAAPSMALPSGINYQGALTDDQGNPFTGTRTMSIKLYDAATGGTLLYSEDIGTVDVSDGVFSFEFGTSGSSNAQQTDTVAITDGTATTFQKVLSASEVVAGSVSVTDGTYTWSQSGGSSNEDAFGVAYSTSLRRVTVTYFNGAPAAGRTITATYRTPTSGIAGALAGVNQPWAEITVDGVAQIPRQKVLTVPFAHVSLSTLETEKIDSTARQAVADLALSVAQTSGTLLNSITSRSNSVGTSLGTVAENPANESWSSSTSLSAGSSQIGGAIVAIYGHNSSQWYRGSVIFRYTDSTSATSNWELNRVPLPSPEGLVVSNPNPSKQVSSVEASAQSYWDIAGYFQPASIKMKLIGRQDSSITFDASGRIADRVFVSISTNPSSIAEKYIVVKTGETSVRGDWNSWVQLSPHSQVTGIEVHGTPTTIATTTVDSVRALFLRQ